MDDQILCVRIAQRVLETKKPYEYSRFPFDRVYLGKKHLAPQFKKLFRYYLSMELDQPLLTALNRLAVKTEKETRITRDDALHNGVARSEPQNAFAQHITDVTDWLMVVPTHVRTVYKNPAEFKEPHKSELAYILSKSIDGNHNNQVKLPIITLVTPSRTVPILCGVCKNLPNLHAGNCIPGQPKCKYNAHVQLRFDPHHRDTHAQSVAEAGEDPCP